VHKSTSKAGFFKEAVGWRCRRFCVGKIGYMNGEIFGIKLSHYNRKSKELEGSPNRYVVTLCSSAQLRQFKSFAYGESYKCTPASGRAFFPF